MIVGIDEAGRGPLVGNVVACALFLPALPPFSVLSRLPTQGGASPSHRAVRRVTPRADSIVLLSAEGKPSLVSAMRSWMMSRTLSMADSVDGSQALA